MVGYLREGAEAIERDELVASVNARDRRLCRMIGRGTPRRRRRPSAWPCHRTA